MDRKLLILDFNGILIYKEHKDGNNVMIPRKGIKDFLLWCFENYDVGIFSSSMYYNIKRGLSLILTYDQIKKFKFIFDRMHVEIDRTSEDKNATIKLLTTIWNNPVINRGDKYNERNTLIVDDSFDKVRYNPIGNILIADKFVGYENISIKNDIERLEKLKTDIIDIFNNIGL